MTDIVPLHAMRAVHINSLPAPTARYTAGATHTSATQHTEGSSYANTAPDTGSMVGGCALNVWFDYQQVCVVEEGPENEGGALTESDKNLGLCLFECKIQQSKHMVAYQRCCAPHVQPADSLLFCAAVFVAGVFNRHRHLGCQSCGSRSWKQHAQGCQTCCGSWHPTSLAAQVTSTSRVMSTHASPSPPQAAPATATLAGSC